MLSAASAAATYGGRVPHAGMPPLPAADRLSRFEYWPPQLFYLPVWLYACWLALRYRGLRLPLVANPHMPASGLVGESKAQVLGLAGAAARGWFAPHVLVEHGPDAAATAARALATMADAGLAFPVVAKPDLGCRGVGVRPLRDAADLTAYLLSFPPGERLLLQRLVDEEGEAGVFYVRLPGEARGRILSLTLKYFPYVTGDGEATLETLIRRDPRAGQLAHLYLPRHAGQLGRVLARGESYRLAFAGSHSRGAIFRDGTRHITPALAARFDAIADAIPEFHFGRFDVRFADIAALERGEGFTIVEVNGAGAEATHIWDARTSLSAAYGALFEQWRLLWQAGAANRARGFAPESYKTFLRRRAREQAATARYPQTA